MDECRPLVNGDDGSEASASDGSSPVVRLLVRKAGWCRVTLAYPRVDRRLTAG